MAIIDIILIIFILLGLVVGFSQGVIKSAVNCIGYIFIITLSFALKNPVGEFMMLHFPFFDFFGIIQGLSVLNIALYQTLAFMIIFGILSIILKLVIKISGVVERIIAVFPLLGKASRILGALVGLVNHYLLIFVILFILELPVFSEIDFVTSSKLKDPILKNTPILSNLAGETISVFEEFSDLSDKYELIDDTNSFNLETLDLFLKYDIVSTDTVEKLVEKDKLHLSGYETIIGKYKEE